jgi:hypothetical protein
MKSIKYKVVDGLGNKGHLRTHPDKIWYINGMKRPPLSIEKGKIVDGPEGYSFEGIGGQDLPGHTDREPISSRNNILDERTKYLKITNTNLKKSSTGIREHVLELKKGIYNLLTGFRSDLEEMGLWEVDNGRIKIKKQYKVSLISVKETQKILEEKKLSQLFFLDWTWENPWN